MIHYATCENDVSSYLQSAKGSVVIQGGGTRTVQTPVGAVLSLQKLAGVVDYEPGALTMVARAGTPLSEIEQTLAQENQRLAFEPVLMNDVLGTTGTSTIGGVFAANASGARRIQAGAARDFLLGVRCVDGTGTIIKNGGCVMKNVTGYDLVKLLAGSWGQLGVLTEVSFKVLPICETETTLAVSVTDPEGAVAVLTGAMATPFDVTGVAYDPACGCAYVRIEGFDKSVSYRADEITKLLCKFGDVDRINAAASHDLWLGLRRLAPLVGRSGSLWRVSAKPTDGPAVVAALGVSDYFMDWSGGVIWAILPNGRDVRADLQHISGHATCFGSGHPMLQPQPKGVDDILRGIHAKFDPNYLFPMHSKVA